LVNIKSQKDPIAAKGMENIIITGAVNDSKTDAKIIYISRRQPQLNSKNRLNRFFS